MKTTSVTLFFVLISVACTRSNASPNPLVGKWTQFRVIKQYVNPFTGLNAFDTLAGPAVLVEFKADGEYFNNGVKAGTYKLSDDVTFSMQPSGYVYTISLATNTNLTTSRTGYGEQEQVSDPNNPGSFAYAKVLLVITQYQK